jgi:hypothetical protein
MRIQRQAAWNHAPEKHRFFKLKTMFNVPNKNAEKSSFNGQQVNDK